MRPLWLATLLMLTSCGMFGSVSEPTREELERACPGAVVAMTIDCPALAVSRCEGQPWAECVERDAITADCDKLIDQRVAECEAD